MLRRTMVITGASDGIGAVAARRLSGAGHEIVVVGRSASKTRTVAAALGADSYAVDFTVLAQVRQLAAQLLERYDRIDVLVNNAGGIMKSRQRTIDGFEKNLQVNHLAPFLLTNLLLDRLVQSRGVILATSSNVSRGSRADFTDMNSVQTQASLLAYSSAKLANILFTKELHRRYSHQGIASAAVHPGSIATNVTADMNSPIFDFIYRTPLKRLLLSPAEKGSEQIVWLAKSTAGVDWVSGEYYENCRIAKTHRDADNVELARSLWSSSAQMVNLEL